MYLPLHGDERQRQLAFLSSASLSRERVVEPTAYELRILKARRQPQVHSSSGFPGQLHAQQRFNEFALTTACEALHESLGVEPELARSIEARFDEEFGSKWKCARLRSHSASCERRRPCAFALRWREGGGSRLSLACPLDAPSCGDK
jgi:hypothetical protein